MSRPTIRRLGGYVRRRLRLARYLRAPGDGRVRPQIPAQALLWTQLMGQILREWSFHGLEALVRSPARRALGVSRRFGDDALGYFTERLDAAPTRQALVATVQRAKRNKAFARWGFIGVALDGTGAGRSEAGQCALCHAVRNAQGTVTGHRHQLVMLSVVGTGLTLPVDVEPYGPGDSEYGAGQRLLQRALGALGRRFADYVVVDGEFATAPFLHVAGALGVRVVARLKANLPGLYAAAQARFAQQPATVTFESGGDRVELWDAADFDPWETLRWPTVRVIRYRQHRRRTGDVIEAYWLTDFSPQRVSGRMLYRMAKSRWEIENQGFNESKTWHGFEHISHHHANSVVISWLVAIFALTIERLYRLRFLRRGRHRPLAAIDLVRLLRLSLGATRRATPG